MEKERFNNEKLSKEVTKLACQSRIIGFTFMLVVVLILIQMLGLLPAGFSGQPITDSVHVFAEGSFLQHVENFEMDPFPDTEEGKLAAYGEKLITQTATYLGPENKLGAIYSGNNLACASCHLNGGTKAFAAPYVGLTAVFPMYSGREGKVATLEDRINGCFERSMNGNKLPTDSKEMVAIISYMKHLSKDVKVGQRIKGQGFVTLDMPDRKADLKHGQVIFEKQCVSCHQGDGQGQRRDVADISQGYAYPPLWGYDSFNDGAGMARMLTAAKFIKGNMPLGASAENPMLTDAEAYDVAAYINSFARPVKTQKELDYPDLSKKPKDAGYPPYADKIATEQHKYGPFNF